MVGNINFTNPPTPAPLIPPLVWLCPLLSTNDPGLHCMRVYVRACLATGRWSEQPGAAHCAPQFTDDVSRWMPPFTNTASPLAAALAALLLSFLFLCKKKEKKAIKAGQKRARMQVVYLEKEKEKQEEAVWECVCMWGGDSSAGVHTLSVWTWMRSPLRDFHNHSAWVIYLWFYCLCTGSTYTFILKMIHILSSRAGWGNYEVRTFWLV